MPSTRDCTFCAIASGRIEAQIVLDTVDTIAFLDHRPLFPGHVLAIPRDHHATLLDLPVELTQPFFDAVRLLAATVEKVTHAEGTFVAINNKVSQSVPHLHVHVVPRNRKDGLRGFFWPRTPYKDEQHMKDTAESLRAALSEASR